MLSVIPSILKDPQGGDVNIAKIIVSLWLEKCFFRMEFDTHIRLKDTGTLDLTTPASFEDVHQRLWDLFKTHCNQVGDGPHGECWLDYSKPLRTRHLVVDMEQDSEQPSSPIHLRFRGGSKPEYLCDILHCGLSDLVEFIEVADDDVSQTLSGIGKT